MFIYDKILITRFLISSSLFANNVTPAEEKKAFTDDDIKGLTEEDTETVEFIQKNIGYFIDYNI